MATNCKSIKLSIVIPSYNQGEFIDETLQSIIDQERDDIEIIVMDGGSSDNSLDIIKRHERHISFWQSMKDNGQSDAINKGIMKSTGEFVTWLNSDDVLLPNTLKYIIECIENNTSVNWFLGNVLWMNKNGQIIKVGKVERENHFWNKHHLFSNGGPSAIMRKDTLVKLGLLREDFKYMMDTELWHRLIANNEYFIRIPEYIWGLRLHENAKMSGHNFKNSPLADKKHPSWIQKRKENEFLRKTYPINKVYKNIWRLTKIFTQTSYTKFLDRKYIGSHFTLIKQ